MKRLKHWLSRHEYRVMSAVFTKPRADDFCFTFFAPSNHSEKQMAYGFTTIYMLCECGKLRIVELYGDHSGVKAQGELAELERMAR